MGQTTGAAASGETGVEEGVEGGEAGVPRAPVPAGTFPGAGKHDGTRPLLAADSTLPFLD